MVLQCFRGDSDCLVDRLVAASMLPQVAPGAVKERELQAWRPDDDNGDHRSILNEPLEARSAGLRMMGSRRTLVCVRLK
jgi:hypothetical protein